jgi:hypothetical protein
VHKFHNQVGGDHPLSHVQVYDASASASRRVAVFALIVFCATPCRLCHFRCRVVKIIPISDCWRISMDVDVSSS